MKSLVKVLLTKSQIENIHKELKRHENFSSSFNHKHYFLSRGFFVEKYCHSRLKRELSAYKGLYSIKHINGHPVLLTTKYGESLSRLYNLSLSGGEVYLSSEDSAVLADITNQRPTNQNPQG